MGLRKAIVIVGSVLVLAACDRASSPTGPMSLHDGPAASAKKDATVPSTITVRTSSMTDGGCQWLKVGEGDSTLVCIEQ